MISDAQFTAQPPPPPPPPQSAAMTAINSTGTISRAPVRYNLPAAPSDIPATEAELQAVIHEEDAAAQNPEDTNNDNNNLNEPEQRSLRPGQKGFAERLMSKYGWTKGSGLGATGSGIINPLRVQVEKQSKKNNGNESRGGSGWLGGADEGQSTKKGASSSRGKIIGGKKKKGGEGGGGEDEGLFGRMSEVVVLRGMVDGLDLDAELHGGEGDGGLMQEIGEECGEKVSSFSYFHVLCPGVGSREEEGDLLLSLLGWMHHAKPHLLFFSSRLPIKLNMAFNHPSFLEVIMSHATHHVGFKN